MDLDSIECVSDGLNEDEIQQNRTLHSRPHPHHHPEFGVSKPRNGTTNGAVAVPTPTATAPAISVHELLECPVCTNSMYPPIHQCHNGHTLCSTCKTRVQNRCPTGRQELGDIRCLALEKVAESLELPCKYFSLGCPEIFPYYGKLKHEAICNFRPYTCPYAGSECSVAGDIPFLVAHLRDDHKVDMHTAALLTIDTSSQILEQSRMPLGCSLYSIALGSTSASILKLSSSEWHLFTWRFSALWATRMRLEATATALRLAGMLGN